MRWRGINPSLKNRRAARNPGCSSLVHDVCAWEQNAQARHLLRKEVLLEKRQLTGKRNEALKHEDVSFFGT